jgi:hypothetical protein
MATLVWRVFMLASCEEHRLIKKSAVKKRSFCMGSGYLLLDEFYRFLIQF